MSEKPEHDPIDRALPGEPRLPLMGRDVLSPGFDRLYAIVRESAPSYKDRAREALERVFLTNDSRQKNPGKDKEHAWSARKIADESEQFYAKHIAGAPPKNRIPVAENPQKPKHVEEPKRAKIGDDIRLIAPVHYRRADAKEGDLDSNMQIGSGSIGTVREVVPGQDVYLVNFPDHPDRNHVVPFDRTEVLGPLKVENDQ